MFIHEKLLYWFISLIFKLYFRSSQKLADSADIYAQHGIWVVTAISRSCPSPAGVSNSRGVFSMDTPAVSIVWFFLSEAVFTYCLSLHVFRAGVRWNNCKAINVAKAHFAPLFYGLSMPFYMETFFRDSVLRAKCPPELLNFLENHESYSVSGNDCKGEGGEFQKKHKTLATTGSTRGAELDQGM